MYVLYVHVVYHGPNDVASTAASLQRPGKIPTYTVSPTALWPAIERQTGKRASRSVPQVLRYEGDARGLVMKALRCITFTNEAAASNGAEPRRTRHEFRSGSGGSGRQGGETLASGLVQRQGNAIPLPS